MPLPACPHTQTDRQVENIMPLAVYGIGAEA